MQILCIVYELLNLLKIWKTLDNQPTISTIT